MGASLRYIANFGLKRALLVKYSRNPVNFFHGTLVPSWKTKSSSWRNRVSLDLFPKFFPPDATHSATCSMPDSELKRVGRYEEILWVALGSSEARKASVFPSGRFKWVSKLRGHSLRSQLNALPNLYLRSTLLPLRKNCYIYHQRRPQEHYFRWFFPQVSCSFQHCKHEFV